MLQLKHNTRKDLIQINNQVLFYGGIIISAVSVIGLLASIVLFKYKRIKVDTKLDEEYGKE